MGKKKIKGFYIQQGNEEPFFEIELDENDKRFINAWENKRVNIIYGKPIKTHRTKLSDEDINKYNKT